MTALALALLLVLVMLLVVGPADIWLGPRLRVQRTAVIEPAVAVRTRSLAGTAVAMLLGGYLLLGVLLPLVALLTTR